MTEIDVPDWVVVKFIDELGKAAGYPPYVNATIQRHFKRAITATLGAWAVREGYIAGPELRGLDAARQLGTKFYGTVWSEPTGQAGAPLYTLRQEKPE